MLDNWKLDLDRLMRIDNFEPDLIEHVVKAARSDAFWCKNFLSLLKLRKKDKDGVAYITVFINKFKNNGKPRNQTEELIAAFQSGKQIFDS